MPIKFCMKFLCLYIYIYIYIYIEREREGGERGREREREVFNSMKMTEQLFGMTYCIYKLYRK